MMNPYLIGLCAVGAAWLATLVLVVVLCLHVRAVQRQVEFEQKRADLLDGKWRRNYLAMASMVKARDSIEAAQADILRGPPEPMPELEPSAQDRQADAEYARQFGGNDGEMVEDEIV